MTDREDQIILEMCKAHDREDAAQKGEPSPWESGWSDDEFGRQDHANFRSERIHAMREAFSVAKTALSSTPAAGVKVKGLEWPETCRRGYRVHSGPDALASYCIAHYGGDGDDTVYRWAAAHGRWSEPLGTYEAAKAAAQAEYDRSILAALQPAPAVEGWRDGAPGKPWADEWFIAETTFRDRVVLRSLPDEWFYDFKTADDTYIKADRITRWMPFPDSQYAAPPPPQDGGERLREAADLQKAVNAAALTWCGEKDRETSLGDITYFKNNWSALPGLRNYVDREIGRSVRAALRDGGE